MLNLSRNSYRNRLIFPLIFITLLPLIGCSSPKPNTEDSIIVILKERASQTDQQNNHKTSLKLYSKLIELEPNNIDNHIGFIGAVRKSRNREAFNRYMSAPLSLPNANKNSDYITEVVYTLLAFNLGQKAREFLRNNQSVFPNKKTLYWLSGAIELSNGNLTGASEYYKNCLAIDPNYLPCAYDLKSLNSNLQKN